MLRHTPFNRSASLPRQSGVQRTGPDRAAEIVLSVLTKQVTAKVARRPGPGWEEGASRNDNGSALTII